MTKKEAFTWKESFTTHDYDILEPFRFHFHGWEFIPRPATILTKKIEMETISHKTPEYDKNIKPHSSEIWSNSRQTIHITQGQLVKKR